ncbi:hypothetical protein RSOL_349630, partial [Rhizoctonia solani AG-3 Rhs1AP]
MPKIMMGRRKNARQSRRQQAEKAAKEAAAKEEKSRKAAAKAAKQQAARAAKDAAEVEKAAKEAKAREAKAAKEAAKGKGKAKDKRRRAGDSDTEIEAAGKSVEGADIKPIVMKSQTKKWTSEECTDAANYIASKWTNFKLKQTHVFKAVSKDILRGSKNETQVSNWWASQWKKFKACLRREVHTGGGDGDDLDKDANQEDDNDDEDSDSDIEILPDETQAQEPIAGGDRTGASSFTEAQLDAFQSGDIYKIVLKVAKNDPEAVKQEEFDSARTFSDSEAGIPGPSKTKSSSRSTDDSDLDDTLRQTLGMVGTAVSTMTESRKASAESAAKKEERKIKAAEEEGSYRKRQLDIEEEKRLDQQRYNEHQHEMLHRRLHLEEQESRDRRREAIGMLSHENEYVKAEGVRILRALAKEEEEPIPKDNP